MVTQGMVNGLPCKSDERGHLLNAHRQCQWCHMDGYDLMIQYQQSRIIALEANVQNLRERVKKLIEAGDAMYTHGDFTRSTFNVDSNWSRITAGKEAGHSA